MSTRGAPATLRLTAAESRWVGEERRRALRDYCKIQGIVWDGYARTDDVYAEICVRGRHPDQDLDIAIRVGRRTSSKRYFRRLRGLASLRRGESPKILYRIVRN